MSEDTPAAPGQIEVGSRLAGYRCEERIGHGGMADAHPLFLNALVGAVNDVYPREGEPLRGRSPR